MSVEELTNEIIQLKEANETLKNELHETKIQLNKYLFKNKTYYEKNKDKHIEVVKKYKEETNYIYKPTPEQKKEWARRAYLKKKEKLAKITEN
jgi:ABC-type nitrate/sulfonate/bicarbonate transport system substrate-binding protein